MTLTLEELIRLCEDYDYDMIPRYDDSGLENYLKNYSNSIQKLLQILVLCAIRMDILPRSCWNEFIFRQEIRFYPACDFVMEPESGVSLKYDLLKATGYQTAVRTLLIPRIVYGDLEDLFIQQQYGDDSCVWDMESLFYFEDIRESWRYDPLLNVIDIEEIDDMDIPLFFECLIETFSNYDDDSWMRLEEYTQYVPVVLLFIRLRDNTEAEIERISQITSCYSVPYCNNGVAVLCFPDVEHHSQIDDRHFRLGKVLELVAAEKERRE